MQHGSLTLDRILRRMETLNAQSTVRDPFLGTVPYRQVARMARQVNQALKLWGVNRGERVATVGYNSIEHVALFLGLPTAGFVHHTVNPRLTAEQVSDVLVRGGARAVFIDASLWQSLGSIIQSLPHVEHVVTMNGQPGGAAEGFSEVLTLAVEQDPETLPELDELTASSLCFTTGTTGNPKGVLYSHRSSLLHAMSICTADVMGISQRDTILPIVPFYHANGWGLPHAAGLTGAKLVLPGSDLAAESLINLIADGQVTIAAGVPTVLFDLLRHTQATDGWDLLRSLRLIVSGGAPLSNDIVDGFARAKIPVVQGWGMTETSPCVTMSHPPSGSDIDGVSYRLSQGRLNPLVDARIVSDDGAQLPWDGQSAGEVEIRSPHAASAYFNDAESSQALINDGWLKTGDIATIDPLGYVRVQDRLKDVIRSGGEMIPSVELERLIGALDSVKSVAVVARPDARWGERPVAFVTVEDGSSFDEHEARLCVSRAAPKWWAPEVFTIVSQLPLTSVGKIDKKALREIAAGAMQSAHFSTH